MTLTSAVSASTVVRQASSLRFSYHRLAQLAVGSDPLLAVARVHRREVHRRQASLRRLRLGAEDGESPLLLAPSATRTRTTIVKSLRLSLLQFSHLFCLLI